MEKVLNVCLDLQGVHDVLQQKTSGDIQQDEQYLP